MGILISRACIRVAVYALLGGLLSSLLCSSRASGAPPTETRKWTPESVCDALERRESKLANCSFQISEKQWLTKDGAQEKLLSTDAIDVLCKDRKFRIDLTHDDAISPDLSRDHELESWDGTVCKYLYQIKDKNGNSEWHGGFRNSQPRVLYLTRSFSVLGFRKAFNDHPWSKWLRDEISDKNSKPTVVGFTEDNISYVKLSVPPSTNNPDGLTISFVPSKDFVLKDMELTFGPGDTLPDTFHVTRFAQFDGFWMPALTTTTSGKKSIKSRAECELKSLSLESPTDANMQIDFPSGTQVMDSIKHERYVLRSDGTKDQQSFYDAATGKIISPATQPK